MPAVIAFPEVEEEINKIPDVNDPRRINYWVQKGNKIIYIKGWSDACLLGTGFPPMEKGGTVDKVMYMEDLTPKILEAKAKEKGLKLLRGGFTETEDKENLYGVTWGVFEAAKPAAQGILTINYTDYRGAGVSKTLPPDHAVIEKVMNEMRREATLRIDDKIIGKVEYLGRGVGLPHGRRWNWWYDKHEVDKLAKERNMNKTVYIAGRPEAVRENVETIKSIENLLHQQGYGLVSRPQREPLPSKPQREPWQMTKEEYLKTAVPLHDREDFLKAWLKDNENIPNTVNPKINYIPLQGYASLVFGNEKGQAVGVITFAKGVVQHIAVSDRYRNMGIATQLIEESRKYGVRSIAGPVSPEFAGIAHRFAVKTAFLENKPIPTAVLREYPDLMVKAEKQKWRRV